MVKTREEQTRKERNTQQRKRRWGFFHKGYQLGTLCGLDVAAYVHNPENGQIYTFSSGDDVWFTPPMIDLQKAHPKPVHMLPKDFEQPERRRNLKVKPTLNQRPSKVTSRKAGNKIAAARRRMKPATDVCSLPEPPTFQNTRQSPERGGIRKHILRENEFRLGEFAFLEELDLNLIL